MSQAQTYYLTEWYASDGLPGSEPEQVATVADGAGNLYVAGVTLNAYEKYDLHLAKYDDEGDPLWTETFNLTDTTANVIVGQMILDNSGNPVITGTVYNGSTNRYDALTVKFNTSGVYQWHELYNGSGNHDDGGSDLYSDSNDNIYITGGTTDDTELMDFLVVAYESDGDLLWSHAIDGYGYFDAAGHIYRRSSTLLAVDGVVQQDLNTWKLGQQYITISTGVLSGGLSTAGSVDLDEIRDIVNDSDNNIYVTGYADNGATNRDIVTLKLDDELNLLWSHTYNGTSNLDDEPHALMVDQATGNVYVAGFTTKTDEGKNIAILKYNSSGTLQWGNSRNGQVDVDDEAFDVAIDTAGQIIVGGYITEEGNKDYFVEILNSSGVSQWIERFNGVHNLDDRGQKIVVELSGRISLTGKTGSPGGDTYTTVRYTPKSILIPPDEEEASSALYFTENRGQLLDTDEEAVPDIKFYSDRQSPALFFQEEGFSLVTAIMDGDTATNDTLHRVDVRFRQSKGAERIYALEPRADFHNYYLGHIPEGREKVGLSDRLIHTDAFTGIDIQYYSNNAGRKYYFVVKPGADPDDIKLIFDGQSSLSVNGGGDLVIGTAAGNIVLPEPEAFLVNSSGVESSVAWTPEFVVDGDTVTIGTEGYDNGKWLVIRVKEETVLAGSGDWITYFGGNSVEINTSLHLDESDNLFVTGLTSSIVFPLIPNITVVPGTSFNGNNRNPFLAKFNPLAHLVYFTVIGGNDFDIGQDVVKMDGFVYLTGHTFSNNFPVTSGTGNFALDDGFLAKFKENDGLLSACRLIGGNQKDFLTSIDAKFGKIYLAGMSVNDFGGSNTFPTQTQGGSYFQEASAFGTDGVVLEIAPADLAIIWSSFFGGEGIDLLNEVLIKEDDQTVKGFYLVGNTTTHYYSEDDDCSPPTDGGFPNCQTGTADQLAPANGYPTFGFYNDLFIAEFEDNELVWTTFFGGEEHDIISVNSQSNIGINPSDPDEISIIGSTDDFSTFPEGELTTGYHQTNDGGNVIATFKSRQLFWVTAFGCPASIVNDSNGGETINYSNGGHLVITGTARCSAQAPNNYCTPPSTEVFPICPPGDNQLFFQGTFGGASGLTDCYLARFNPDRELTYSSYLGGSGSDAIGSAAYSNVQERIFIVGNTNSLNFPTRLPESPTLVYKQENLAGHDGFIARIAMELVTALEEEPEIFKQEIALYPNPSAHDLNIAFRPVLQNTVLRIFSSSGQMVQQVQVEQHATKILLHTANLPAGIYHVMLDNTGASFIKH